MLVFPTIIEEAFGISQVEAMAAALTVISSATGGAQEIIEHGASGLTFHAQDEKGLADSFEQLIENPDQWAHLAADGQKCALERFDINTSVDELERQFRKMLHGKDSGRD